MKTIHLFDCDGVILNSNRLKNEAFFTIAQECNHPNALEFFNWCSQNNGISRHVKLKKLLDETPLISINVELLVARYSELVHAELLLSQMAPNLRMMRDIDSSKEIGWGIISGGSQDEIISVLKYKGVDDLFDLGIFGNPKNKYEIFHNCFEYHKRDTSFVYFGDSKYDYEFASAMGLSFVFVSDWSNSSDFFKNKNGIKKIHKLHEYWGIT